MFALRDNIRSVYHVSGSFDYTKASYIFFFLISFQKC